MKGECRGAADNEGCGFILLLLGVAVLGWVLGWSRGYADGVRAHAKGEAVVVSLPDGTDTAVKVKKEPKHD